jgi:UDP-glucose 4-epimerase
MILGSPTVIVLGAAGFVGRHTARVLAAEGCRVLGLGHGRWTESEWRQWGLVKWLDADIGIESIDQIAANAQPSCIIHCGGSGAVSFSYSHPLQDFERAVHSTAQVLEWIRLRAQAVCRFVLVSSAAVYGDQGDTDASENSSRAPISPYGVHKLVAESICESYSRFFDVSSSIVRLFSVYGEGLRKQLLWDALNKFQTGQRQFFGTGNELRDWVHVQDAARLLALAGLAPQSSFEVYNGGLEHASTRNVLSQLAAAYGLDPDLIFNGETLKGNPRRLTANCGHTMRLLNWSPEVRLDEGLARYVAWFKALRVERREDGTA